MDNQQFSQLVKETLENLPEFFKKRLENVDVVVEETSNPVIKKNPNLGLKKGLILGLYQGIPQNRRTQAYQGVLPDKITLYKRHIERIAGGKVTKIKEVIKYTIQHEIAHHFGISDKRMKDLGVY
jgi:predicted Zn-dependent protease with MMP-like domain